VDGQAYSQDHPMAHIGQRAELCCLTGIVRSRHSAVGGGRFLGVRSPPSLDI
jgi:hypothetical protein